MKTLSLLSLLLIGANSFSITVEEWETYTNDQKVEYIENESSWEEIEAKDIPNQPQDIQDFVASMEETDTYLEVEYDYYALIGGVQISYSFVRSDEGIIIGAMEHFFQQGCSPEDEDDEDAYGPFETETEANEKNCFDNDVSWSGYGVRNEYAEEIEHGFLEWSGH
jgi:hypothetical protein